MPCCRAGVFLLFGIAAAVPAQQEERPLGWIQAADGGATITARGSGTSIGAQAGDFLFAGDQLDGSKGAITFYYCPNQTRNAGVLLQLRGELILPESAPELNSPTLTNPQPVVPCLLPRLERQPEVATVRSPAKLTLPELSPEKVMEVLQPFPPEQKQWFESVPPDKREDPQALLALGVLFENANLWDAAAAQYLRLARLWPDQPRLLKHLQRLLDAPRQTRMLNEPVGGRNMSAAGSVYALVVGISRYEQAPTVPDLAYADQDALFVQKYLESARGGKAQVKVLLNQQATTGAIRNMFLDLRRKAGRNDTVWVFVAAHGEMLPLGDAAAAGQKIPSIITHRADPQDVRISSFPMQEAENWILGKTAPFGRAMIFLDLCHAGHFVEFRTTGGVPVTTYFGIMATHQGPDALAYEHRIFDGGHGAFTYFLLRGLNTDEARAPGDSFIRAARLGSYVRNGVEQVTSFHQSPTPLMGSDLSEPIADFNQPGIPFQKVPLEQLRIPDKDLVDLKKGRRGRAALPQTPTAAPQQQVVEPDLRNSIDLEDRGEQVLLDYLKGDQTPQTGQEFEEGYRIFTAALQLQPGSPYLEARASFCRGRVLVFRKQYPAAMSALERSVRLEPDAAYAYNALGIARLETGEYDAAARAFQDAIDRAPLWAYPRHNLALAHVERGRYDAAIAAYRAAMERAPSYFYLPYNLGLLYARLNRDRDAEEMYRRAMKLAPQRMEPPTALAQLEIARGNHRKARRELKQIVRMQGQTELAMQAARHNYALLLSKDRKTFDEALALWKQNGDYLPSQFSLAQALARQGRTAEAIDQYRHILTLAPDAIAARLELVSEMEKGGHPPGEMIQVLQDALANDRPGAVLYERLGGFYRASGRHAEARDAYRTALQMTTDPTARKRIENLMKRLPN